MNKFNSLLESSYFLQGKVRRSVLTESMSALESSGIHCMSCSGTCCTSVANSMLITPLETLELFQFLLPKIVNLESRTQLKMELKHTISSYRLDKEIYTGKKSTQALRKLYTCPFFNNGALGCSISRAAKPYGCLGFNPKISEDNGKSCASMTDLLLNREESFYLFEQKINQEIRHEFSLTWEKQNIPMAVLEFIEIYESLD